MERYTNMILLILAHILFSCNNASKHPIDLDYPHKGHLVISPSKCIIGSIKKKQNKIIIRNINLINKGNDTIIIKKIDVSCGCISTKLESMIVTPQKSIILNIKLNPNNLKGYFNKVIYINSNADNPLELLRIKGEISD